MKIFIKKIIINEQLDFSICNLELFNNNENIINLCGKYSFEMIEKIIAMKTYKEIMNFLE